MSQEESPALERRVADWLQSAGYPLEMTVARRMKEVFPRVQQSEFYPHAEGGLSREIDVVATAQRNLDGRILRVAFPVECKVSKDKPWLVFTDSSISLAASARITQRAASWLGKKFLRAVAERAPHVGEAGLFRAPRRPGYSVTRAFESSSDKSYQALMAVTNAAAGLARGLEGSVVTAVYFPLVVIDGPLFEVHLGESNQIIVERVEGASLIWRNPGLGTPHTIVHIATLAGLEDLAASARETADILLKQSAILAAAVGRPSGRQPHDPEIES